MAKTKKTATPVQNTNGITDISHEVLYQPPRERMEYRPPEEMTPEKQINLEIAKFNLADSAIAQLKDQYGSLTISGADDKDGYKKVREAWYEVRSKRTGLEKKGLELRSGYGVITKAISKEEARLVNLIRPLEDDLYGKWGAIDDEKERVQREKEEAEQAELMQRIEQLQKLGMVLEGGFYSIGGVISVDAATLRAMPEEAFLKLKSSAQRIFDQEQAEKEKAAQEKRREAEELKRQQEEVKQQQAEMRRQQDEIQKQRAELERAKFEAQKERLDNRKAKFEGLGMESRWDDLYFSKGGSFGISIPFENLQALSETDFSILFVNTSDKIKEFKEHKAKQDAQEKAELEARAKAAAIEDAKREEERKAEAVRLAKLALSDKERYDYGVKSLEIALLAVKPEEFKTLKYQKLAKLFVDKVQNLLTEFR